MATNAITQDTRSAESLKSNSEMSPQQQQQQQRTTTPTLNNLLPSGNDSSGAPGTPAYSLTPQGSQHQPQNVQPQMQIPPHMQHMIAPPQPNFATKEAADRQLRERFGSVALLLHLFPFMSILLACDDKLTLAEEDGWLFKCIAVCVCAIDVDEVSVGGGDGFVVREDTVAEVTALAGRRKGKCIDCEDRFQSNPCWLLTVL
ncbi:unnamed protein product [Thelazia callipaeda]|uniref:GATA-type domain-containing protein n=1 Tax=Thelazia callipaeda TaxID=103827 RepID=A0A0N5D086_THECL|nr:unnamed protein product [Thelazia callipaeda]